MNAALVIPPELAGAVRLGWVPEAPRELPLPAATAAVLGGGLPRGRMCEVTGARGSGRTALVYSLLAAATAADELTALVDAGDAFDPAGAARAAIRLGALLWVRPPSVRDAPRCAEIILASGGFGLVVLDIDGMSPHRLRAHVWPRLARAAEKAGAALVVLAAERLAGGFAAASVKMTAPRALWSSGSRSGIPGSRSQAPSLFEGIESHGVLVHNKRGPLRASPRIRWKR